MAEFIIKRIKYGYEGRTISEHISIEDIVFSDEDEVVFLPTEYEGEPITHFGYGQAFEKAHEEWADWHHPAKGSDWVPDRYSFDYRAVNFPLHVKKLVIPATITDICYKVRENLQKISVEVSPDNPRYTAENGILTYKK